MTQLNRRAFLTTAAATTAAALANPANPASPANPAANTVLSILRTPDRATAFLGEDAHKVNLSPSGSDWQANGILLRTIPAPNTLSIEIESPSAPLHRVHLRWNQKVPANILIMGDAWERSYGDLAWRGLVPERVLPWYFATNDGNATHCYGVQTGPAAFCFWQIDPEGVSLWLDLSNGGNGVQLGPRELAAATIVSRHAHPGETPHQAIAAFCHQLCPDPRLPKTPIYGSNDWYYAYGKNSAEGILRDTDLIVSLAPTSGARPFSVIDAGWAGSGTDSDVVLPNPKFPDMAALADQIRQRTARPGIWIRPTQAPRSARKSLLLPLTRFQNPNESDNEPVYDPTIPEALQSMLAKLTQVVQWNYELVKHDYSTYDLLGQWGSQMGPTLTRPNWNFNDRSKTNAEIILSLYKSLRAAAGDNTLLLGCNTVGHLAAGLFEVSRTGDDTSGQHWERTRRMGVNTLAHRLPQNGAFFLVDADCVGITETIPWEMNRQWLDLLARSGTALFISPSPGSIGTAQRDAIREAFAIAAAGQSSGHPTDSLTQTTPQQWQFQAGAEKTAKQYDWCGEEGCDPWPI